MSELFLKEFPINQFLNNELCFLLPFIILGIGGTLGLIFGSLESQKKGHCISFSLALLSIVTSGFCVYFWPTQNEALAIGKVLSFTPVDRVLVLTLYASMFLGLILIRTQTQISKLLSEIYSLAIFSLLGMCLLAVSNHLIFQFITIEIMSLGIYVMVAFKKGSLASAEASLKYFVLGGLASAFFLYGSSLVFGGSGSFLLQDLAITQGTWVKTIGLVLVFTGLLFKVGAFPFHGWVPDVYMGAPLPVTAIMAAIVKFAAFIVLVKVSSFALQDELARPVLEFIIIACAIMSMAYGNFVALAQKNIKKLLAYSSIAHTGYLLVGVLTLVNKTESSIYLYLISYVFLTLGTFAILQILFPGYEEATLLDLNGLGLKNPGPGFLLTLFFLGMAGIPLTSGFIGKFLVFSAGINAGHVLLSIFAMLTSVVAAFYYLQIIVSLYFKQPEVGDGMRNIAPKFALGTLNVAYLCGVLTLQFGLFPSFFMSFFK
jgi:NADH-quinone oxidoreductase subunit N